MGLEGVELIIDIEDRFDTSIPGSDAGNILTVGQLHEFLMMRIRCQATKACPSAAMFYPLRKILTDRFGVDRNAIRPSTPLESVVKQSDRNDFWHIIEHELVTKLPRLKRSRWLQWSGDIFPPQCSTVGQLIQQCVDINKVTSEFGPDDDEAVWRIVREIVASVACVDESEITPDTIFVNDLGF